MLAGPRSGGNRRPRRKPRRQTRSMWPHGSDRIPRVDSGVHREPPIHTGPVAGRPHLLGSSCTQRPALHHPLETNGLHQALHAAARGERSLAASAPSRPCGPKHFLARRADGPDFGADPLVPNRTTVRKFRLRRSIVLIVDWRLRSAPPHEPTVAGSPTCSPPSPGANGSRPTGTRGPSRAPTASGPPACSAPRISCRCSSPHPLRLWGLQRTRDESVEKLRLAADRSKPHPDRDGKDEGMSGLLGPGFGRELHRGVGTLNRRRQDCEYANASGYRERRAA